MKKVLVSFFILLGLLAPIVIQGYWLQVFIISFYYAILAVSWSLLAGQLGLISLGHVAFAAVGAYTSALLVINLHLPIYLGMLCGALGAAIVGLGIGILTLKMRGPYLTLTTLAFSEIFRNIVTAEYEITRGSYGLNTPLIFDGNKMYIYYLGFFLLLLCCLTYAKLLRTRIGLFFVAMREDEVGALSRGISILRYRLYAFVLTSAFAGLAGGYYAHVIGLVSPQMTILNEMGLVLAMGVFGGFESIIGPIFGALFLQPLAEFLRTFVEWRLAIFSGVVLLVLKYNADGVYPQIQMMCRSLIQKFSRTG